MASAVSEPSRGTTMRSIISSSPLYDGWRSKRLARHRIFGVRRSPRRHSRSRLSLVHRTILASCRPLFGLGRRRSCEGHGGRRRIESRRDRLSLGERSLEELRDEPRLEFGPDAPLELASAVLRLVADLREVRDQGLLELQLHSAAQRRLPDALQLEANDGLDLLPAQGLENDHLVHPVQELRPEVAAQEFLQASLEAGVPELL